MRELAAACWAILAGMGLGLPMLLQPTEPPATANEQAPWPFLGVLEEFRRGGPASVLAGLRFLEANESRVQRGSPMAGMYFDVLATVLSFTGDHRAALEAEAHYCNELGADQKDQVALAGMRPVPARKAILDSAKDARVLMINEEHRISMHRAFLESLLEDLRREGFTHLAMETLNIDGTAIGQRGYPMVSDGFYLRDPALGNAVRRALELDFVLYRYEPPTAELEPAPDEDADLAGSRRDRLQAENLARLLELDPAARVVVYAGRYHISERGDAQWTPMAKVIKDRFGIDPVTVDLLAGREAARPEHERGLLLAAEKAGLVLDEPFVLISEDGQPYTGMPGGVDMQVVFPRTTYTAGRPDWLVNLPRRTLVDISRRLPPLREPALLRADTPGEPDDATPVDQVVARPAGRPPGLVLPPGSYRVRVLDAAGQELQAFECEVN